MRDYKLYIVIRHWDSEYEDNILKNIKEVCEVQTSKLYDKGQTWIVEAIGSTDSDSSNDKEKLAQTIATVIVAANQEPCEIVVEMEYIDFVPPMSRYTYMLGDTYELFTSLSIK